MVEVRRFKALGESGALYTVIGYGTPVVHRPLNGPARTFSGSIDYRLADGRDVSERSDGHFEIFDTEEILRTCEA